MEDIFHFLIAGSSTDLRQIRSYKDKFPDEFESKCIDAIWTFDNFHYPNDHSRRRQFVDLVQRIIDGRLLTERLLRERLDTDLLHQIKMLADQEGYQRKIVRTNTALFYKQAKFNLLRESLRGYSHFFTSLFSDSNFQAANSLVSRYSLDPNCCLEMLVDFACTDLLSNYKHLQLFLTNCYANRSNLSTLIMSKEDNFENETNRSNLMRLLCLLIRDGFVQSTDVLDAKAIEKAKNFTANSNSFDKHPSLVLIVYHLVDLGLFETALQLFPLVPNLFEYKMICKKVCEFLFVALCESRRELFGDWFTQQPSFFSSYEIFLKKIRYFLSHCNLSHFPPLILLVLKVANWAMRRDKAQKAVWFWIFREHLQRQVTALTAPFSPLMDELGEFLFNFNYKARFCIYSGMMKGTASGEVLQQTRKALRRLSTETVKVIGKSLCKLACLRPSAVFGCCLDQMQAYDNMIVPIVDSFKYLFPVEYDIFTFSLIEALANPTKGQLKDDAVNLSDWLQNLALFCGTAFKKYRAMNLEALVHFLFAQLGSGNLLFLHLFDELIYKMTGNESAASLTDAHLEVLSAGPLLRSLFPGASSKKSLLAFKTLLGEGNLAQQLFILIAYQLNSFTFDNPKLTGSIVDKSKQILAHLREIFGEAAFADFRVGNKHFHFQPRDLVQDSSVEEVFSNSSLAQIHLPTELYQREIEKATSESNAKLAASLESERSRMLHSVESFLASLSAGKFSGACEAFANNLLLERCINSTADSLFCVKFVQTLNSFHPNEALQIADFFSKTFSLLASMTEGEVANYARLYRACLEMLPKGKLIERGNELSFGIIALVETDQFIVLRNCVIFLRHLLGAFPVIPEQASLLEHSLHHFRADARSDIKVLANSYLALLIGSRGKLQSSVDAPAGCLEQLKEALEKCLREKVLSSMEQSLEIGECQEEPGTVAGETTSPSGGKRRLAEEETTETKRYRQDGASRKERPHGSPEKSDSRRPSSHRRNKY